MLRCCEVVGSEVNHHRNRPTRTSPITMSPMLSSLMPSPTDADRATMSTVSLLPALLCHKCGSYSDRSAAPLASFGAVPSRCDSLNVHHARLSLAMHRSVFCTANARSYTFLRVVRRLTLSPVQAHTLHL